MQQLAPSSAYILPAAKCSRVATVSKLCSLVQPTFYQLHNAQLFLHCIASKLCSFVQQLAPSSAYILPAAQCSRVAKGLSPPLNLPPCLGSMLERCLHCLPVHKPCQLPWGGVGDSIALYYIDQHRNPNMNNKDHIVGQLTR